MEDSEQKFASKTESERVTSKPSEYEQLFERIAGTNILPSAETEWSLESLEQTLDQVFSDYGNAALEANGGKIHTTLSGGLDSTLAVAYLRKNFPDAEIHTFTMGGTEEHPDVVHARMAAEKFATVHHEYIPTTDEMAVALSEYDIIRPEADLQTAGETGNTDVYILYKYISQFKPKVLLAHDGIDELTGGYWPHRKHCTPEERATTYKRFWDELIPNHLIPLTTTSENFGVELMFPYIDERVVKTISKIPLLDRSSKEESKKPLRAMAERLGVPQEILTRSKRGQVGMLDLE